MEAPSYEAPPSEKEAVRRVLARREGRSSAPRVSICHEGETDAISLTPGDPVAACAVRLETSLKTSQMRKYRPFVVGIVKGAARPFAAFKIGPRAGGEGEKVDFG